MLPKNQIKFNEHGVVCFKMRLGASFLFHFKYVCCLCKLSEKYCGFIKILYLMYILDFFKER